MDVQELCRLTGLTPLYRCPDPEHQKWGLYAEDQQRPGLLVCGCRVSDSEPVGYE